MVLSSNKHIECDLLWKVGGAVTLVLRRIPKINGSGSAKVIVFDVKLKTRSYSEFNKTITQSNQEFPNYLKAIQ